MSKCALMHFETVIFPRTVTHLDVSYTNFTHMQALTDLPLETLNLEGCEATDLSVAFEFPPTLKDLNVSNTNAPHMEYRALFTTS